VFFVLLLLVCVLVGWQHGEMVSIIGLLSLGWAQSVLGWVTVFGRVNRLGM